MAVIFQDFKLMESTKMSLILPFTDNDMKWMWCGAVECMHPFMINKGVFKTHLTLGIPVASVVNTVF